MVFDASIRTGFAQLPCSRAGQVDLDAGRGFGFVPQNKNARLPLQHGGRLFANHFAAPLQQQYLTIGGIYVVCHKAACESGLCGNDFGFQRAGDIRTFG